VTMTLRVRPIVGLSIAAYAITVVVVAHLAAAGTLPLDAVASSPAGLLHGRLWTMLTSGLVSADNLRIVHSVVLAAVLVAFAARHGARLMAGTALAAHIGSALLAYAGLLLATASGLVSDHADLIAPDYGTSCVWFGCVGALLVLELIAMRGRRVAFGLVLAAGLAVILVSAPIAEDPLTTAEHLLALAIGAAIGAAVGLRKAVRRPLSARF
jgi:hypothetical protein